MSASQRLTVFFDGACPLCRKEIAFYRRRRGAKGIAWVDVSKDDPSRFAPGLDCAAALARFHVRLPEGRLVSGGLAFAELWVRLPAFRWAGLVFRRAPFRWLLEAGYELFLPLRPTLQRLVGS